METKQHLHVDFGRFHVVSPKNASAKMGRGGVQVTRLTLTEVSIVGGMHRNKIGGGQKQIIVEGEYNAASSTIYVLLRRT